MALHPIGLETTLCFMLCCEQFLPLHLYKTCSVVLIYRRLRRSRSSVSKSKRGCCTSEGPWDWSTEDDEEMTVVWPDGWIVLNWNWGPIHRRRWGPVWVTISTCEYQRGDIIIFTSHQTLRSTAHWPELLRNCGLSFKNSQCN